MKSSLAQEFEKQLTVVRKQMRNTVTSKDTNTLAAQETLRLLASLPFWCGDDTLHETNSNYRNNHCCTTHTVGLPRHSATNQEMPLTPYQVEFANIVIEATTAPTADEFSSKNKEALEAFLRLHHFFHVLKGRQMGFTEIVLRITQHFCWTRYAGYNVGIIAATNGNLAKKDLRRFARLFKHVPIVVTQWIKSNVMILANNTIVEAFKASEEAITGHDRFKCIIMDEAAKWLLVDDTPIFNSIEPIIRSSAGDLFLVSTGKGPVKTFYKIVDEDVKEYTQLQYNIWRTLGNLYTEPEINIMLASKTSNPDQEYMCKFTTSEDSIYGEITSDNRGTGWSTWDADLSDGEDDNYKEDDSDWDDIHEKEKEEDKEEEVS